MAVSRVKNTTSRPRPSTIKDDPTEWDITEDGYEFSVGDILFNYYDCCWVKVASEPDPTAYGWFHVRALKKKDEAPSSSRGTYTLNSVRVSAKYPEWYTPNEKDLEVEPNDYSSR